MLRNKIRAIAILTGITLVLLELVLQVGALVVWLTHSPAEATEPKDAGKTVLCVGDSYTYGMGSSGIDHSYPAQLEKILAENLDDRFRVINDGWPARNSREALERMPHLLETSRPRFVCILIGINDLWSRPEHLKLDADSPGEAPKGSFRLRWRTGRLIAWLMGDSVPTGAEIATPTEALGSTPDSTQAATPLADTAWRHGDSIIVLAADGRALFSSISNQICSWSVDGETLLVSAPDGQVQFQWKQEGDTLTLLLGEKADPIVLIATAMPNIDAAPNKAIPSAPTTLSGWELYGAGDLEGAKHAFLAEIARSTDGAPSSRSGLIEVLAPAGEAKQAMEHLRWLETAYARDSTNRNIAESLVGALNTLGFGKKCMDTALASLDQFPGSASLWYHAAWHLFQHGHEDRARAAIAKCIELAQDDPSLLAYAQKNAATIDANTRPRQSLEHAVHFFLLGGAPSVFGQLLSEGKSYTEEMLTDVIGSLHLSIDEQRKIERLYHQAKVADDEDAILSIYEDHLRQMVLLSQENGATTILVSYPWFDERFTRIHQRLADETRAGVLDLATQFEQRLIGKTRSDYFIADGHCNDAGYKIMAQIVADDLKSRIE